MKKLVTSKFVILIFIIGILYFVQDNFLSKKSLYELSLENDKDHELDTIRLALRIQIEDYLEKLARGPDLLLYNAINEIKDTVNENNSPFLNRIIENLTTQGVPLNKYFGNKRSDDESIINFLKSEEKEILSNTIKIIHNRFELYGLSKFIIKPIDPDKIFLEVVDISDKQEIINLVQKTGLIEFRLERNVENTLSIINKIEEAKIELTDFDNGRNFSSLISTKQENNEYIFYVDKSNLDKISDLFNYPPVKNVIPNNVEFLFSYFPINGKKEKISYRIFLVNKTPELTGGVIIDANVEIDKETQLPLVEIEMNAEGTKEWSIITGANVSRKIAAILDSLVIESSTIRGKMMNGIIKMRGFSNLRDAEIIALLLKSGTYPVPVEIINY
jgi:SecD/SecF fusion protein